jgi:ribose transport system permease protein
MTSTEPSTIPPPVEGGRDARSARSVSLRKFLYDYAVFLLFIALIVVYSIALPSTFPTSGNFQTIVDSQAVLLILALGLTVPLVTGEFDLSIGSMLGFASILTAWLLGEQHWGLAPGLLVVLAAGALVGTINGFLVVRVGVGAFITTLATGTILSGLTVAVSNGEVLNGIPDSLSNFTNGTLFGLSATVYMAAALAFGLWLVYEHTTLGRNLFFVGAGRETARLVGLPVARLRWGAFVFSGVVSSAAGILAAAQLGGSVTGLGESYLLPAYAAAFLGATTIKPGRFNAWGTVVALYLVVTGTTGLELMGVSNWVESVFDGVALIVAITFAQMASRRTVD